MWMQLSYKVGKTRAIQLALGYGIVVQSGLFLLAEPGNVAMFWGYTFFMASPMVLCPRCCADDGRRYRCRRVTDGHEAGRDVFRLADDGK